MSQLPHASNPAARSKRRRATEYVAIDMVRDLVNDPSWSAQIFTPRELAEVAARRDVAPGLAARLAAKRAVLVALHGTAPPPLGEESRAGLRAVEILTRHDGSPIVDLEDALAARHDSVTIHVSMSHDGGLAAALVVVVESSSAEGSASTD